MIWIMQFVSMTSLPRSSSNSIDKLRAYLQEHDHRVYTNDKISQMTYKNLVYAKRQLEHTQRLKGQ